MVRRLFSLTDIFDNWQTGKPIGDKPRAASLNDVTLYTSLESCAQCSGVMSLAGVKQIVYLQNDFTAYKIGNIMYNLANRVGHDATRKASHEFPCRARRSRSPASEIDLDEFKLLNDANLDFAKKINAAKAGQSDKSGAFFVGRTTAAPISVPRSRRSCAPTTRSRSSRRAATSSTRSSSVRAIGNPRPATTRRLNNEQCLAHAQKFYKYADVEGYRGSPHKL